MPAVICYFRSSQFDVKLVNFELNFDVKIKKSFFASISA